MIQMDDIVNKFGVVVCSRTGSDIDRFIYESDLLTKSKVFCLVICALIICLFLLQFICICLWNIEVHIYKCVLMKVACLQRVYISCQCKCWVVTCSKWWLVWIVSNCSYWGASVNCMSAVASVKCTLTVANKCICCHCCCKNIAVWSECFVDQHNIEIVREWMPNEISSTRIRYSLLFLIMHC